MMTVEKKNVGTRINVGTRTIDRANRRAALAAFGMTGVLLVASASGQPPSPPAAASPSPAPAADPVETDIRVVQLLEAAASLRAEGNVEATLDSLRDANALVKRAKGANHPDQLPILDQAAEILIEADRLADAEQPLMRAVAIRERLVGSGQTRFEVELASSLLLLGKVHASVGKFDKVVDLISKAVVMLDSSLGPEHEATFKARRELTQAVTIFEETLGPDHPATLRANDELVSVDRSLGDIEGAVKAARRNFEARSERLGPGHPEVLARAIVAAELLEFAGRPDDAVHLLSRAIEAFRAAGADDGRPLVPALRRLGRMHLDADDFSPAETAFEAALAIDREGRDGEHPESLVDRLLLLTARSRRGGEKIAEDLQPITSRLEAIASTLGPPQPEQAGENGGENGSAGGPAAGEPGLVAAVANGLRLAGGLWLELGEPDRAAAIYRRGLELDTARLASGEPEAGSAVADDHEGLGRCLLANGDATAARKLFEEAAADSLSAAGPADPRTLRVIVLAARAAAAARDAKGATSMLDRLVERGVAWQGAEEPELCRVFDAVAALHEEAGAAGQADAIRAKLVDLRRRQFGPRDPRVAATLVEIANARQAARRWDAAIPFYEEALAIQQAAIGRDHPDVAATLLPVARAYRAVRRNEDAAAALTRALAIWEASVGPSHPVTLATVKSLALVLLSLDQRERALPLMERLLAAYDADPATPPADVSKLLTKLAEIRAVRGESAAARVLLARAVKIEGAVAASEETGDNAENVADIARVQRMLGSDEQSAANLARAREIATRVAAPPEQMARIEAAARQAAPQEPTRPPPAAEGEAAASGKAMRPQERTIADVILAAWEEFDAGDADLARDMIGRTLLAFEREQGTNHPEIADLLVAAADMRSDMAAAEPAASQYERAWKIRAAALGESHPKSLVAQLRLVACRESAGRVADAERTATEVLARAGGVFAAAASTEDLDAVRDAARRGAMLAMAGGDRKVARILVETAATVMGPPERRLGFALLDALGDLLATGRSKAASELRGRLLEALAPAVRGSDTAMAKWKYHAAVAGEQAGDDAAAAAAYAEALALDEKAHGPTSPEAANAAVRLAAARARAAGRPAKLSEEVRQRVRSATAIGDRADDPVEPLRRLAATLLSRGETEEAGRVVKSAIDIEAGKGAGRSTTMLHLLSDAADVQVARGNYARAEESLREAVLLGERLGRDARLDAWAVAIKLDRLGTTTTLPAIAETAAPAELLEMAWKEQLSGRPGPAQALFDRAIELVESKDGPDSTATARSIEQAASAAMRSGDGPRARQLLERLLGVRERIAGADDPGTAEVAIRLAGLLAETGELSKAKELADRAVGIRQRTAGPTAAETLHAMAAAARIHLAAGDSLEAVELRTGIPLPLPSEAGPGDLAAALEAARLDLELGDVEAAVARSTAVCEAAARGEHAADDLLEQGLEIQCDGRLAAGQPEIAAGLARRLVAIAEAQGMTGSAAVGVQLARLAAALHAAGDSDGWRSAAARSSAILAPVTARMSQTSCRTAVIAAVRKVTSLLVESGFVADAAGPAAALEHAAAAAMTPAHAERSASLVLAARVAHASDRHERAMAMLADAAAAAEARSLPQM